MFAIGKKLAEEATQQAESAVEVAGRGKMPNPRPAAPFSKAAVPPLQDVNAVGQTVQQAVEQAKDAGQKALDEVYKATETGEKAVKNVANQATSWGKSFGQ